MIAATGRPNGWEKTYESLVDTPLLRSRAAKAANLGIGVPDPCASDSSDAAGGKCNLPHQAPTSPSGHLAISPDRLNEFSQDDSSTKKELDTSLRWNDGSNECWNDGETEKAGSNPVGIDGDGEGALRESAPTLEERGLDLRPRRAEVPERYRAMVEARVAVVSEVSGLKGAELRKWVELYNLGMISGGTLRVTGQLAVRTVYRWVKQYQDDGAAALVPGYEKGSGGRKIPVDDQNKLLALLLHPNRVRVTTAVNVIADWYRIHRREMGYSVKTAVRWCEDWRKEHLAQWTLARGGVKQFQETINKTIIRDWDLVEVGDAWMSDGHTLEVMIIDPRDGKARKHEIIVWFDCRSRMPVGASINITENTEGIQIAFRNAALWTGYVPLAVYIDNAKAYVSKYFTGENSGKGRKGLTREGTERHGKELRMAAGALRESAPTDGQMELMQRIGGADVSAEDIDMTMQGVYGRLGVKVINSMPYNAKAKHIERWWQSLQEEVERFMTGWTGSSPADKPATMLRNEKYMQQRFPHQAVTVEQFKQIFEHWAVERYGKREHRGLGGRTPLEVFIEGSERIDESRRISADQLNYLMLAIDQKRVTNQGIRVNGVIYWDVALVHHVKSDVRVRWDYWDVRSVLVYDENDRFICQAGARKLQHPLVRLSDDPQTVRELVAELKQIKGVERDARQAVAETQKRIGSALDEVLALPETKASLIQEQRLIPGPDSAGAGVGAEAESGVAKVKLSKEVIEELRRMGLR